MMRFLAKPSNFVWLVYSVMAAIFLGFIYHQSVNIFYWDQWDLYGVLFNKKSWLEMFWLQPGNHRQGIVFVVQMILAGLTQWDARVEAVFVAIIHVLSCGALILLKRKIFKKLTYADVVLPGIFFSVVSYSAFIAVPFPALGIFPLLLFWLWCLVWLDKSAWKYVVLVVLHFLLMFSGYGWIFGLFIICVLALSLVISRKEGHILELGVTLFFCLINVAIFLWGFEFGREPILIGAQNSFASFPYIVRLFGGFFIGVGSLTLATYLGAIVFIGASISVIFALRNVFAFEGVKRSVALIYVGMFGFSFVFALLNFLGRGFLGLGHAFISRYTIFFTPAFVGIYFSILAISNRNTRNWTIVFFAAVFLFGYIRAFGISEIYIFTANKREWKECYLANEDIAVCDKKTNFMVYPDIYNKVMLKSKLDFLKQNKLGLFKS